MVTTHQWSSQQLHVKLNALNKPAGVWMTLLSCVNHIGFQNKIAYQYYAGHKCHFHPPSVNSNWDQLLSSIDLTRVVFSSELRSNLRLLNRSNICTRSTCCSGLSRTNVSRTLVLSWSRRGMNTSASISNSLYRLRALMTTATSWKKPVHTAIIAE